MSTKYGPNNTKTKDMYKYSMRYQWRMNIMTSYYTLSVVYVVQGCTFGFTQAGSMIRIRKTAPIIMWYRIFFWHSVYLLFDTWNYFNRYIIKKNIHYFEVLKDMHVILITFSSWMINKSQQSKNLITMVKWLFNKGRTLFVFISLSVLKKKSSCFDC